MLRILNVGTGLSPGTLILSHRVRWDDMMLRSRGNFALLGNLAGIGW